VAQRKDGGGYAEVTVSPGERAFAGHFPGFPVLPGVCVIEVVRRAADGCLPVPVPSIASAGVESARFTGVVRPGDTLAVDLTWTGDGPWRCAAVVRVGTEPVATVRLRYDEVRG